MVSLNSLSTSVQGVSWCPQASETLEQVGLVGQRQPSPAPFISQPPGALRPQPRGVTPCPRSGAVAENTRL